MKKYHFKTIDSTSSYLKNNYDKYENLTFVSSDYQSDGHGRYNRKWISNKRENLLFSLLIKDENLINKSSSLSLVSAVVIYKVLKNNGLKNVFIKWPNDVYVNNKKIAGILLESVSFSNQIQTIIVGVGLNVNSAYFNEELKNNVTSLYLELNKKIDIDSLKESIYKEFEKELEKIKEEDNTYLEIVRNNNYLKNKEVYIEMNNEKILAQAININDDNSLKVKVNDEFKDLYSGEVTFKINMIRE